jgi:DNA-directed RNA polymerase subunit RPC12/RpoP
MSDEPKRRPILSLKNPPKVVLPEGLRSPAPAPVPVQHDWKCKPCGAGFSVDAALADEVVIRCPSCNAKLGLAGDFRADPPPAKLRARPAAKRA